MQAGFAAVFPIKVSLLLTRRRWPQAKRRTEDYRKAASVGASSQPQVDSKLRHLTETSLMLVQMLDARSIEIDALGQFEEQQRLLHAALEVIIHARASKSRGVGLNIACITEISRSRRRAARGGRQGRYSRPEACRLCAKPNGLDACPRHLQC